MTRPLEPEGQAFIHGREAFRAQAYDDHDGKPLVRDVGGVWRRPDGAECLGYATIGWGQRIWGPKYYGPCTREQADQWFQETVADHCARADRYFPDANPFERGALVSVSYNCGHIPDDILNACKRYQAGEIDDAGLTRVWCSTYIKTKGVENYGLRVRRAREVAFYLTPTASTPGTIEFTPEEAMARAYSLASQIIGELVA